MAVSVIPLSANVICFVSLAPVGSANIDYEFVYKACIEGKKVI